MQAKSSCNSISASARFGCWNLHVRSQRSEPCRIMTGRSSCSSVRSASSPAGGTATTSPATTSSPACRTKRSYGSIASGAAKDVGLPLVIGSEIRLQDGPRLVLLATDREGYGNLSDLITRGRCRTKKGSYSLCWDDLDDGLRGCLVLLVPHEKRDAGHARCVAERFADRAWIAAELLQGPDDRAQLTALREL